MAKIELKQSDNLEALESYISTLKEEGEKIVTNTLHNEGANEIIEGIRVLLPQSRRKWKKKKPAAKMSKVSIKMRKPPEIGNLKVTVGTTNNYHYLYFPNDGTNTKVHAGKQNFMEKGAESKQGKIVDICIKKLIEKINN
ncbi:HK97-gp10 family putative phage morphogenesis protein [uncultured Eubacterium sp.]|uniref:HK97-gp10 family putative phage morphogenesis protein n=1 Tax=uncultured Eubacterium sp. TaxID=165185 RepID=UPI0026721783|nr:HK97-gp10 family putative phage morphogenesis protein [uncultured Eubacterium sp.]